MRTKISRNRLEGEPLEYRIWSNNGRPWCKNGPKKFKSTLNKLTGISDLLDHLFLSVWLVLTHFSSSSHLFPLNLLSLIYILKIWPIQTEEIENSSATEICICQIQVPQSSTKTYCQVKKLSSIQKNKD